MTSIHIGEAKLSRRSASMSTPSGDSTDDGMLSDLDEKTPRHERRWSSHFKADETSLKKPLIDYVTNEWQTHPNYKEDQEFRPPGRAEAYPRTRMDVCLDLMDDFYDGLLDLVKSPKFWHNVFIIGSTIAFSLWVWFSMVVPHMREAKAALATFDAVDPSEGRYGLNRRPSFPNMIQLRTLDPDLLPVDGNSRSRHPRSRRLVFVGDIHGCKHELVMLLDKMKFNPKHDHLITTGDMIDKGPDSLGVVDLLLEMNASCVRGNHEDRVLQTRNSLQHMLAAPVGLEEQSKSPKEDDAERALARSLGPEQAAYLQSCPVILRVGDVSAFRGEVVVVHAGLVPGVPLVNQDPSSAMTMRVIDLRNYVPSRDHKPDRHSVPWTRLWNKVQKVIPNSQSRYGQSAPHSERKKLVPHMTVIYGHDSKRGLQLEQWTKGLDSGCVKGGKLSALVLSDGGKHELVQVKCKNYVKSNRLEAGDKARKNAPGRKDRNNEFA